MMRSVAPASRQILIALANRRCWVAVAVVAVLVAIGALQAAVLARTAGARSKAPALPLTVQSASVVQDGQDLVWQVELAQPFSPGALARDHDAVCLVIERAWIGSVVSQVCLAGPGPGDRTSRLIYAPLGHAAAAQGTPITATVTRSSDRELTASFLPSAVGLGYRTLRWQVASRVTSGGCARSAPGGADCATLVPVSPSLLSLHTPRLAGCVATGRDHVFRGPSNVREIALTFDDGPWNTPLTADFVSELARLHVTATFFEIGRQITTYDPHGTVERQMLAEGDMIGDHTWSHPADLPGLSAVQQRQQLSLAAAAIRKATDGFEPCLFRSPYGNISPALLAMADSMGFATIQWDIDPRDWALPGVNAIVDNVVANAHNGAIIEEHFGGGPRYETLDALPLEVADLRAEGYQFVTLTQMLGYRLIYR